MDKKREFKFSKLKKKNEKKVVKSIRRLLNLMFLKKKKKDLFYKQKYSLGEKPNQINGVCCVYVVIRKNNILRSIFQIIHILIFKRVSIN